MTNEEISKWLMNLKDDIGKMRYQPLWHYAEALDMAIEALSCSEEPNRSDLVKESSDLVKDLVNDCISRQDAIDAFEPDHRRDWYTPEIIETLEALPSVQPKQRTGEWIHDGSDWTNRWICSKCGYKYFLEKTNYCPNCGADMRGEQE